MREGVLTEREWRKQARHAPRQGAAFWGAQCMLPIIERKPKPQRKYRRYVAWTLSVTTVGIAVLLWLMFNTSTTEYPIMPALSESVESLPKASSIRPNSAVVYRYPELPLKQVTFTRSELLRGKMMRIDQDHPLPADVPGPNTVSIATYGKGMVPVRDLTLKSGKQTIDALYQLFLDARQKSVEGLTVWRASLSQAELRELQLDRVRVHAAAMSLNDAVQKAREEIDDPQASDFQQEYTVDIRLYNAQSGAADDRSHGLTQQGRYLLQTAWRYGFIRRYPRENDNPYREYQFRYVGVAHSTAMTYLDLDLEGYLDLLHEKPVIQIFISNEAKYLIICKPLQGEYVSMLLPEGASYEASYDNMGYAVVACTLQ